MHRPLQLASAASLLLIGLLPSCATTSWRFTFDPSPAETLLQPRPEEPVLARALTTVIEGRREGGSSSGQPMMHLRIMIENRSAGPVHLTSEGMKLVGSNLEVFGAPVIDPLPGEEIPPGQPRTYELDFPYPEGMAVEAPEIEGLNLSWTLAYPGGNADVTQTFVRREWQRGYSDGSSVHWGIGIGTTIH